MLDVRSMRRGKTHRRSSAFAAFSSRAGCCSESTKALTVPVTHMLAVGTPLDELIAGRISFADVGGWSPVVSSCR